MAEDDVKGVWAHEEKGIERVGSRVKKEPKRNPEIKTKKE